MTERETFDPRPARYPDVINARAPRGCRERIRQAAEAEHISMGEFVRRAVAERIEAACDGDGPSPFRPDRGQRIAT